MHPATRALHETVIRAIKMMLAAWERWLKDRPEPVHASTDEYADTERVSNRQG